MKINITTLLLSKPIVNPCRSSKKSAKERDQQKTFRNIGVVHPKLDRNDQALVNYSMFSHLEPMARNPTIGAGYVMIGLAYQALEENGGRRGSFNKSDRDSDTGGDAGSFAWPALYQKGLVCRDRQNYGKYLWMEQSVDVIVQVRGQVPLTEQKWTDFQTNSNVDEDL